MENTLVAERDTYAFVRHNTGRTTGKERWKCPARAGKIQCAACPLAGAMPPGTPQVSDPPDADTAPRGCQQATITVPWDVSPKLRQPCTHGSPEWIADWTRRSLFEGAFGNWKNPYTENVNRGWIAVVGIVKTTLLAAVAIVAMNLRLLRKWAKDTGDMTDPLCHPDPEDHGFEEIEAPAPDSDHQRPGDPPGRDPGPTDPAGG